MQKMWTLYIKNGWFLYKEMVLIVVNWKNNVQHKSYKLCFIGQNENYSPGDSILDSS